MVSKKSQKVGRGTMDKVLNDEDYVHSKVHGYSLERMLDRYPEGCPDKVIARALMIPEDKVVELYEQIVEKLKKSMEV